MAEYVRRPAWLKLSPLNQTGLRDMTRLTHGLGLHTVCESARCPNRPQCFGSGTATFMLLGDTCTRNCTFCAVKKGKPLPPDPQEPERIAVAVSNLKLKYAVITSVTRDDLADGGAIHFARVIKAIHEYDPGILVEALIPDFKGSLTALRTVTEAQPAVLNHNVETVPRLYPEVRPGADYGLSLELLKQAKVLSGRLLTKSGVMVGLGESRQEIVEVMVDLREAGCDILTIGQYLAPSLKHHRVMRYVAPEEFAEYKNTGERLGFRYVASGPLVRSSFHAAEAHLLADTEPSRKACDLPTPRRFP